MPLDLKQTFPENERRFFKPIFHGKKTCTFRCPKGIPSKHCAADIRFAPARISSSGACSRYRVKVRAIDDTVIATLAVEMASSK